MASQLLRQADLSFSNIRPLIINTNRPYQSRGPTDHDKPGSQGQQTMQFNQLRRVLMDICDFTTKFCNVVFEQRYGRFNYRRVVKLGKKID